MSISAMSPPTSHQEQDYHSFDSSISMNRRGTMPNLDSLNLISVDSQSSSEAIQRRNSLNNLSILLSKNVKHDQQSQSRIQSTQINHPSSIKGNGNAATANLLLQLLSSSQQQQQSANRRHSSALSQTKQIRAAQLNLLAQQANLASTGSSNLKTAKAANLVLGTALVVAAQKEKRRQSMGQFRKSNKGLLLKSGDEKNEMEECAISSDSDEDGQPGSSERKRYNNEKSRNTSNSFSSFGSYHDLLNSNKTQRTEKVAKEYAEQLAKTFQGDSFLDVAGEVAKDFSSFYKAEREWTGRALRRQSQEEEAALENKMELDGQFGGGNGKGKKRELSQLERERGNSDDFEMIRNNNKRQRSMNASNSSPEFYRRVDPNVITSLESSRKSISSLSKVQSPSSTSTSTLMNPPMSIPSPSSNSNDGTYMDHRPRSNSKISPLSSRNTSPIPPLLSSSTPIISITPASTNTSPVESISSSRSQNPNISFSNSSLTDLAHRASLNFSSPDSMSSSMSGSGSLQLQSRSQSFSNNSNSPTKLTSVLSNFATLLESREQSCEGLESLVKNSKSLTPLPNVYQVLEEKKREKYGSNVALEGDSSLGDSSMESESGEDES